jgi:hypothetical protein
MPTLQEGSAGAVVISGGSGAGGARCAGGVITKVMSRPAEFASRAA